MKIIREELRTEKIDRFCSRFNLFFGHNEEFEYIAVVSKLHAQTSTSRTLCAALTEA